MSRKEPFVDINAVVAGDDAPDTARSQPFDEDRAREELAQEELEQDERVDDMDAFKRMLASASGSDSSFAHASQTTCGSSSGEMLDRPPVPRLNIPPSQQADSADLPTDPSTRAPHRRPRQRQRRDAVVEPAGTFINVRAPEWATVAPDAIDPYSASSDTNEIARRLEALARRLNAQLKIDIRYRFLAIIAGICDGTTVENLLQRSIETRVEQILEHSGLAKRIGSTRMTFSLARDAMQEAFTLFAFSDAERDDLLDFARQDGTTLQMLANEIDDRRDINAPMQIGITQGREGREAEGAPRAPSPTQQPRSRGSRAPIAVPQVTIQERVDKLAESILEYVREERENAFRRRRTTTEQDSDLWKEAVHELQKNMVAFMPEHEIKETYLTAIMATMADVFERTGAAGTANGQRILEQGTLEWLFSQTSLRRTSRGASVVTYFARLIGYNYMIDHGPMGDRWRNPQQLRIARHTREALYRYFEDHATTIRTAVGAWYPGMGTGGGTYTPRKQLRENRSTPYNRGNRPVPRPNLSSRTIRA